MMSVGKLRNMREEGYAFLVVGANRDIFLHKSEYKGNWHELREHWRTNADVKIKCELTEGPKGLKAINATLYDGE